MDTRLHSGARMRGGTAAAVVLFAAAIVASGAPVGGGFWPAVGNARIVVKGAGLKPVSVFANLRFDFDGSPADPAGTGTVRLYDAIGQNQIAQVPFQWTTGRGASFKAVLSDAELGAFIAARIAELTGGTASVTLETAAGRGALRHGGSDIRVSLGASGEVSLDGGAPSALRVTMHLK